MRKLVLQHRRCKDANFQQVANSHHRVAGNLSSSLDLAQQEPNGLFGTDLSFPIVTGSPSACLSLVTRGNNSRVPSRRQNRQLEQRLGPLWRYHVLVSNMKNKSFIDVMQTSRQNVEKEEINDIRHCQTFESSEPPLMASSSNRQVAEKMSSVESNKEKTEMGELRHGSEKDPLIEFMERNGEDAAILLSMWTALKRSCFYGSEISEQLSLRVRYIFHTLIQSNAVAAAFSLYERLVDIGVSLRHSDLLLLLTSLPYETAERGENVSQWIEEEKKNAKERQLRRERELNWREENEKTLASLRKQRQQQASERNAKDQSVPAKTSLDNAVTESTSEARTASVVLPESVTGQPEWVKRWVLYEASMGNFNLFDTDVSEGADEIKEPSDEETEAATRQDDIQSSNKAMELMKLMAVIDHLELLNYFSSNGPLKELIPSTPSVSSSTSSSNHRIKVAKSRLSREYFSGYYSKEALKLLKQYTRLQQNEEKSTFSNLYPVEFQMKMRNLIRSSTWKDAYAYIILVYPLQQKKLASEDALLFLQLAGEDRPWRKQSKHERFLEDTILPCFYGQKTTEAYAVRALWIVHLCMVKSSRKEDFVFMVESLQSLRGDNDVNEVGDVTIAALVEESMQSAETSLELLYTDAKRWRQAREADRVLASSIRSGAYVPQADETQLQRLGNHTQAMERQERNVDRRRPNGIDFSSSGPLSYLLFDTLLLLLSTMPQVVSLSITTLSNLDRFNRDIQLKNLERFVKQLFCGPRSLPVLFEESYSFVNSTADLRSSDASPAAIGEKHLVALRLSKCLVLVATEFCRQDIMIERKRSASIVRALLDQCLETLKQVNLTVSELNCTAIRNLTQLRTALFEFFKQLQNFLLLSQGSENVLFGALNGDVFQCFASFIQILHRVESSLASPMATTLMANFPQIERRNVYDLLPRKYQETLQMLAGTNQSLSRHVRGVLSNSEYQWLSHYVRPRAQRNGNKQRHPTLLHHNGISDSTLDFASKMHLRESLYRIIVNTDRKELEAAIISWMAKKPLQERFFIQNLLVHSFGIPRGSLSMQFFKVVLDGKDETKDPSRDLDGKLRWWSNSSSWLKGIEVYWNAVDHTSFKVNHANQSMANHEKDVLNGLLIPLLKYSMMIDKRDKGREWRRVWAQKFSSSEKELPTWKRTNVKALHVLKDASVLQKSKDLLLQNEKKRIPESTLAAISDEENALFRSVAVSHRDWKAALEAVTKIYGEMADHEGTINPYPLPVVHTMLNILSRSEYNLSNTALRLRTLQHTEWDLEATNLLLKMLLRARRWKKALDIIRETRASPPFKLMMDKLMKQNQISSDIVDDVMLYLTFATFNLQACAIGSESDLAGEYFEEVKAVAAQLGFSDDSELVGGHHDGKHRVQEDSSSNGTPISSAQKAKMDELLSKSRRYFFRAVTKNMSKSGSKKGPSFIRSDDDDVLPYEQ